MSTSAKPDRPLTTAAVAEKIDRLVQRVNELATRHGIGEAIRSPVDGRVLQRMFSASEADRLAVLAANSRPGWPKGRSRGKKKPA